VRAFFDPDGVIDAPRAAGATDEPRGRPLNPESDPVRPRTPTVRVYCPAMDRRLLAVTFAMALAAMTEVWPASSASTALQAGPLPAPLSGFADEGRFIRYVEGTPQGTIAFTWRSDGTVESRRDMPAGIGSGVTKITAGKDGRWLTIAHDMPNGSILVTRAGGVASGGGAGDVPLKDGAVLFGSLVPVLFSQAVRQYDKARGGPQILPVFNFTSGTVVEAAIRFTERVTRTIGGRQRTFARFTYSLPRADFVLLADDKAKIYMADNTTQQQVFVREGYEALLQGGDAGAPGQGIKGRWQGDLDVTAARLRIVLDIAQPPGGEFAGTLDSPDQNVYGMKIDLIEQRGQAVRLEIHAIQAVYEGTLDSQAIRLTGQWKQGGRSLPLDLERGRASVSSPAAASSRLPRPAYTNVDDYVRDQMAARHIPGLSVAVIRDGQVVLAKGYGTASVEFDVPATADTKYLLASMTKSFTATAIMMLVEEGRVDLDQPIARYLSDAPAAWSAITVRHLLAHTSGLKHRFESATPDAWLLTFSKDAMYKSARSLPLDFQPGEQWQYSDQGYFLLGMIIEHASGRTYPQFLAERIFNPLQMTSTTVLEKLAVIRNLAPNYTLLGTTLLRSRERDASYGLASHFGVVSTVSDLAKWDAALYTEKLLKTSSLKQMWTPARLRDGRIVAAGVPAYGFGWFLDEFRGHRIVSHGGATGTSFTRYPDDHLTVIVLTSLEAIAGTQADLLAEEIAAIHLPAVGWRAMKESPDPDPRSTQAFKEDLARLATGQPDMTRYAPDAAAVVRALGNAFAAAKRLGLFDRLQTLAFLARDERDGVRIMYYRADFNGATAYFRLTVGSDGRIARVDYRGE
jgi:CubicO group peptidase (beta-lactamase class C family)